MLLLGHCQAEIAQDPPTPGTGNHQVVAAELEPGGELFQVQPLLMAFAAGAPVQEVHRLGSRSAGAGLAEGLAEGIGRLEMQDESHRLLDAGTEPVAIRGQLESVVMETRQVAGALPRGVEHLDREVMHQVLLGAIGDGR